MSHTNHYLYHLFSLLSLSIAFEANNNQPQPTFGTKCLLNQVVTKLTVYEDGAIEAECNKLPCGTSGTHCNDEKASCRAETNTFSGMKWASNGQSILQRCCTITVPRKIYIGTDLVSLGSYYTGGVVDQKDLYAREGTEFDFISNVRTEQGGVRIWVYRVICPKTTGTSAKSAATIHTQDIATMQNSDDTLSAPRYHEKQATSNENAQPGRVIAEGIPTVYRPINPLQYRPPNWRLLQRDSPIAHHNEFPSEKLSVEDVGKMPDFERSSVETGCCLTYIKNDFKLNSTDRIHIDKWNYEKRYDKAKVNYTIRFCH